VQPRASVTDDDLKKKGRNKSRRDGIKDHVTKVLRDFYSWGAVP